VPEDKQDAIAGSVLSQLEDDRKWEETSARYADNLRALADEAIEDHRAGRTTELDPETL
jgi:hypothetical protein